MQRPIQICFAFFRTILFLGRKFTNSPLEFRLLSAPAATTAAPIHLARSGWAGTCCSPGHHSARSHPPCSTPLPATGRGKVAEHVRKSCALSRRRLATPSRESSAPPARPGEAGPSEAPARRRRAPYDLQGRPEGLPSRRNPAAKASGVQESSGPSVRAGTGVQKRSGPTVRKKKAVSSVQPSSAELSALGLGENP